MASTKCSWKRGSTAVSIFSTVRDDVLDLAPRRAADERDQRAGPGRVAGGLDVIEVGVGDQPEDHRVERVDLAAERAGEADLVDGLDPGVIHQQPDAGIERGLGELDRPDVVLGDDDAAGSTEPSWRTYENVRPSGTIRGVRAAEPSMTPSRVMTPARIELGDHLDDAAAADAGDAGGAVASGEPGLVGPWLDADDPEPRLEVAGRSGRARSRRARRAGRR